VQTEPSTALLDRVRKLLAKAENEAVTPPEAEALTAKAAELMARYGIDRARLAATQPDTDKPGNRVIDVDNPWAAVKAHLLTGLATNAASLSAVAGCQLARNLLGFTGLPGLWPARIPVWGGRTCLSRSW